MVKRVDELAIGDKVCIAGLQCMVMGIHRPRLTSTPMSTTWGVEFECGVTRGIAYLAPEFVVDVRGST